MKWSGIDVEHAPIIGTLTTIELKANISQSVMVWPSEECKVVEIINTDSGKIYITNKWYKKGVPAIVHEKMVETFKPKQ